MEVRFSIHPEHGKSLDTAGLRREFLVAGLFTAGEVKFVYSHTDRLIVGGAMPTSAPLKLSVDKSIIGADSLLEARELGVINLGASGTIRVDGTSFNVDRLQCLYVGKGSKEVELVSASPESPAKFYLVSGTAHRELPSKLVTEEMAKRVALGSPEECNQRTIIQAIHPDVVDTCSLVMGYTRLEKGSVWNTMPCHTHDRRTEVYLYFDLPKDAAVFHLMGQPEETRHIVVRNEQAVLSPTWSLHSGVGTSNYTFVWAMVGENKAFTDMDAVPMGVLL